MNAVEFPDRDSMGKKYFFEACDMRTVDSFTINLIPFITV